MLKQRSYRVVLSIRIDQVWWYITFVILLTGGSVGNLLGLKFPDGWIICCLVCLLEYLPCGIVFPISFLLS